MTYSFCHVIHCSKGEPHQVFSFANFCKVNTNFRIYKQKQKHFGKNIRNRLRLLGYFIKFAEIEHITSSIRKCLANRKEVIEEMSVIKPFSFVLEDEDKESVAELYIVDGDTVIIDPEMMPDLDKDLDDFLRHLLDKDC